MNIRLKNLNEQALVITGASSGIGLTTARMAARRGARLMLVSRNEQALQQLTDEINNAGGQAIYAVADVADEQALRRAADKTVEGFGGFDTWINNAGVSIYGRLMDVPIEDMRKMFETNFWGVVYGSRIAAEYLRRRGAGAGGALINIGSSLSYRAIPLQGIYSASKHAVKGFTDALRTDGAPISVTLIKPGAIDTPYKRHAKNFLSTEPENPLPVYAPEVAARAILYYAGHPTRDLFVGGGGKMISLMGQYAPRLTDKLMKWTTFDLQHRDRPARDREDNSLYQPADGLRQRSSYDGHVAESSLYTQASLHPIITGAAALGVGLALSALWRARH